MTSTLRRSLAKAALWKVLGVSMLIGITWLAGASMEQISGITVAYHSIMLGLYIIHERAWSRVRWGKIDLKDTD